MPLPFSHRSEAGRELASLLARDYADRSDVIVLALPRGGVPVAYEIARALDAPLDLVLVRKIGLPGQPELAMGAIASGGAEVRNDAVLRQIHLTEEEFEAVAAREREELHRRERAYRDDREPVALADRCVILVDDGLATGSTMLAAVEALRTREPARIVIAAPVAPPETVATIRQRSDVDEVVCVATPHDFGGVGQWYRDFEQTTDDEVRALLQRAWALDHAASEQ